MTEAILEIEETDEVDGSTEKQVIVTDRGQFKMTPFMVTSWKAGFYEPGWGILDYLRFAIENYGWENFPIWGIKGSKKSNRLMLFLYWIYGNWNLVHKYMVMKPLEFTSLLKDSLNNPEKGVRIPMVGWDDMSAWLDSQLYFENRGLYTNIKRCWTLMRTKLNVFASTCPLKTELPGFILRDINAEVFCSPKLTLTYDRWTWRKNYFDPMKVVKRPINVLNFEPFDYLEVPTSEFKIYWDRRMGVADIATGDLVSVLEEAFGDAPNEEEIDVAKKAASEAGRALRLQRQDGGMNTQRASRDTHR
jgi:hypothetical protein